MELTELWSEDAEESEKEYRKTRKETVASPKPSEVTEKPQPKSPAEKVTPRKSKEKAPKEKQTNNDNNSSEEQLIKKGKPAKSRSENELEYTQNTETQSQLLSSHHQQSKEPTQNPPQEPLPETQEVPSSQLSQERIAPSPTKEKSRASPKKRQSNSQEESRILAPDSVGLDREESPDDSEVIQSSYHKSQDKNAHDIYFDEVGYPPVVNPSEVDFKFVYHHVVEVTSVPSFRYLVGGHKLVIVDDNVIIVGLS